MSIGRAVFYPERNERLNGLLKEYKVSAYSLTTNSKKRTGEERRDLFAPTVIYEILEGKREVTEKCLERIFRLVPRLQEDGILPEWILGHSLYKTRAEKDRVEQLLFDLYNKSTAASDKFNGFNMFMKHYGYTIAESHEEDERLEKLWYEIQGSGLENNVARYRLIKDGETVTELSPKMMESLFDTFAELITLFLSRL